jgi:WD40 repeat protein
MQRRPDGKRRKPSKGSKFDIPKDCFSPRVAAVDEEMPFFFCSFPNLRRVQLRSSFTMAASTRPLFKVIVAAGTYDGVLAGWELDGNISEKASNNKFKILFASPEHEGSVRSLSIASRGGGPSVNVHHAKKKKKMNNNDDDEKSNSPSTTFLFPGSLLSCGYDEMLRTHDFSKNLTSSGEVRTPSDFGTPTCCAFAPPMILGASSSSHSQSTQPSSTHCLLGFAGGKLVIYKKRDWNVQHVLNGHDGGVASIAVHPTGKMALTGGESDGKLKLWDLTKGRLSYSSKIRPKSLGSSRQARKNVYDAIVCIVWSNPTRSDSDDDNSNNSEQSYAFCYGNHVTVRDVATGRDLLDVDLPSKVNQICLLQGEEGLFLAAACDDGSLPVLAVGDDDSKERRAIMAIEPVDGPIAGEERFKCIHALTDYHVVAANSAGVISLMNLRGAINMISTPEEDTTSSDTQGGTVSREDGSDQNEEDSDSHSEGEEELAVDIIDSVQLGSGARITSLVAWCQVADEGDNAESDDDDNSQQQDSLNDASHQDNNNKVQNENGSNNKRKFAENEKSKAVAIDAQALERARSLVAKAKKIQKRKEERKKSQQKNVGR